MENPIQEEKNDLTNPPIVSSPQEVEGNKVLNIKKLLSKLGDNIDEQSRKVILDHEEDLKDMGCEAFYETVKLAFEDSEAELNVLLHSHLLMSLSDEDLLLAKQKKVESLRKLADLHIKRKTIALDFLKVLTKTSANIIMQALLVSV